MSDHPEPDNILPGVGLRADGLPDIAWCEEISPGEYTIFDHSSRPSKRVPFVQQHPFRLAQFPVTLEQFSAFMRDSTVRKKTHTSMLDKRHPHAPCTGMWWSDIFTFSHWLDQKYRAAGLLGDGWMIDVASEIEWELAFPPSNKPLENFQHLPVTVGGGYYFAYQATGFHIAIAFMEWCYRAQYHTRNISDAEYADLREQRMEWMKMGNYIALRDMLPYTAGFTGGTWSEFQGFRLVYRPIVLPGAP